MQREYGRLKLNGTIMSKRDLKRLVDEKVVRGWDDPRLYTLKAIRRRGVTPSALLSFIHELGVTTAQSSIDIKRFEQSVRRDLESSMLARLMLVLDPVRVTIEDTEEQDLEGIPFIPRDPSMGCRNTWLTRSVYVDRSDFREVDSKNYFRLAPGKTVGLLHMPYPIRAISFTKDKATGAVQEIKAVFDKVGEKPKAYIQWVPEGSPTVEARIYSALFKSEDPKRAPGVFMNDINLDSETVWSNAMVETAFYEVRRRAVDEKKAGEEFGPENIRFQAMRVAYFVGVFFIY